ncbi:crossover junction endonuclease EME1 isoform X2 [Kryptolebias marmoratus]|uniref:crossover junction endonuclease EME1 isoform X2 n=1 Tax=Kryptolebias marmoratus TaxID=37003 RepID=UPI0018ACBC39|nr:crossover junction endonuclease EME1 isoform X2 [Kryptolebias marmoratus]
MMGCDSDCTSDLDEELPVFTFLQPSGYSNQKCQRSPEKPDSGGSDAAPSAISSLGASDSGTRAGKASTLVMISSDSDDDVPYVPLTQRLQHRQNSLISTSSAIPKGNGAELCLPPTLTSLHQVKQTTKGEFEDGPLGLLSPTKKKATKRTAEEIQDSREEIVRRRHLRDTQKEEKMSLRQEQEREKAERRALADAAKALRPEECIKHMVVAVDPALLQLEGGGTLLASVQALGCSCAIEKQALPRSVSWARRAQMDDGVCVPEAHVVMQMTVDNFITLICNYIQEARHGRSDCGPTLTTWVQQQQRRHPSKVLSLAVIELEKYFRGKKSHNQKRFREREASRGEEMGTGKQKKERKKDGAELLPEVSRVDVEEALVHLQLHTSVSVQFSSTWKEFSDYIVMTTKAVAEAPFKREREKTGFSFCLETEWAGGQRVDKAGKGLLQVWKRQIQQLNRVSPDMAAAILAAYPSPQLLRKILHIVTKETSGCQ